jgi:DNA-binding MarR family transcriptional regulator
MRSAEWEAGRRWLDGGDEKLLDKHPSEIAGMLYCDRPTATVILRNMARQGWVTRQPGSGNRKRWRIRITPAGRAKHRKVLKGTAGAGRRFDPAACFSAEESELLERLLACLLDHVRSSQGD